MSAVAASTREVVRRALAAVVVGGSEAVSDTERPIFDYGLDSLALLKLLAALEREFGVTLGDAVWSTKGRLSIDSLAEWIDASRERSGRAPETRADKRHAPGDVPSFRAGASGTAPRGVVDRLWRAVAWRADAWDLFRLEASILLARDVAGPLPVETPRDDLSFRELPGEELAASAPAWAGSPENLARWAAEGFICLTAWSGDTLVATDWLAPAGDHEASTGLYLRSALGSCFALGLFEHPEHKGRGFGLALALRSLYVTRALGFKRQTTMVDARNLPMLQASTHLLGFEVVGRVDTVAVGRRIVSTWQVGAESGVGGVVPL